MKKIIFLAILFGSTFTFSNCKKDDTTTNKPTSANISVSLKKLASETGTVNCSGMSVELHSNALYTAKVKSAVSSGTSSAGTALLSTVPNGKYYLMAWKDVDASNSYTAGDYFGFVEVPVVLDGASKTYSIDIYLLKN